MRTVAVCIAFVVTCTSESFVAAIRYMDPMSPQPGSNGDIGDKRMDLIEPSCDELRAMWRYTKRQSRATRGNGYSTIYQEPGGFLKIWPPKYPDRTKAGTSAMYRGESAVLAKTRQILTKFLLKTWCLAFVAYTERERERTVFSFNVKSRYYLVRKKNKRNKLLNL